MFKRFTPIFAAAMLCLAVPAFAKKKGKKKGDGEANNSATIIRQFDTNGNQQLEGDEVVALKAAFAAAAPGTTLKNLDRNTNGVLDDDEVTALNAKSVSEASKPDASPTSLPD